VNKLPALLMRRPAPKARTQAQMMVCPQSRLEMLKLAESYESMAEIALEYSAYRCDPGDELINNGGTANSKNDYLNIIYVIGPAQAQ
jgi:hypothetical protein